MSYLAGMIVEVLEEVVQEVVVLEVVVLEVAGLEEVVLAEQEELELLSLLFLQVQRTMTV